MSPSGDTHALYVELARGKMKRRKATADEHLAFRAVPCSRHTVTETEPHNISHSIKACRLQQIGAVKAKHWVLSITPGIYIKPTWARICISAQAHTWSHLTKFIKKIQYHGKPSPGGLLKKGIKKWANNILANFSHFHSCNESLSTFRQSEYRKCSSLPFTTRDFDHALIRSVVKAKGNKHERREVQGTLLLTGAAGKIKASKTINKAGFCFVWFFFFRSRCWEVPDLTGWVLESMLGHKQTHTQTLKHTHKEKYGAVKAMVNNPSKPHTYLKMCVYTYLWSILYFIIHMYIIIHQAWSIIYFLYVQSCFMLIASTNPLACKLLSFSFLPSVNYVTANICQR